MKNKCPSDLRLEEYWLTNGVSKDLQDHISSCSKCSEKIQQWKKERTNFNKQYSFERFLGETSFSEGFLTRLWNFIVRPVPVWKPALALTAMAVLVVVLILPQDKSDSVRSKGGPELGYYVLHNGEKLPGKSRMTLSPGDKLMFYYSSDKPGYLLLFGVEANGLISVYYPFKGNKSGSILKGEKIYFSNSIRWQPNSKYERFFAIFSETPLSIGEISDKIGLKDIERIKNLQIDYPQTSFIVYNEKQDS